jgi:hypothetical protein
VSKNLKEREDLEGLEKHIKTDFKEMGREVLDWFYLAQSRVKWRAVVKMVMKL